MGQRHQIYVVTKNSDKKSKNKIKVEGIHHQWLFGINAIRCLKNFLTFIKNNNKSILVPLDTYSMDVLKGSYSIDFEEAYVSRVSELNDCDDPREEDNNNGITVIDLRGDTPKYCFLSISHLECDNDYGTVRHPNDPDNDQDEAYVNFSPICVKQWIRLHYGKEWNGVFTKQGDAYYQRRVLEMVNFVDEYPLLTVEELFEIFPKMVSEIHGEGLFKTPNAIRFMDDESIKLKATTISKKRVKKAKKKKVS